VADRIGSSFMKTADIWEAKLRDANAVLQKASAVKAEKEFASSSALTTFEVKSKVLQTTKEALQAAQEAVCSAARQLAEAQGAVDSCELEKKSKAEERDSARKIYTEHFEVLKAGDGDKKLLKPLVDLLKKLNPEASLVDAVGSTFAKKLDARGEFDMMVANQLGEVLTSHIAKLDEFLSNFENVTANKMAVVEEKKVALEAARQNRTVSVQAVMPAESARVESSTALQEAKAILQQFEKEMSEQQVELSVMEGSLWYAKDNLETFNFLYGRKKPEPESPVEEVTETAIDSVTMMIDDQQAATETA